MSPVLEGFGLELDALEVVPAGKRRVVRIVRVRLRTRCSRMFMRRRASSFRVAKSTLIDVAFSLRPNTGH